MPLSGIMPELAAQANHGVSVGSGFGFTPREIKYLAENSEAKFAIVEDQEQVDKLLEIKAELPLLKKVIYWNYKGLVHYDDPVLMRYKQVLEIGKNMKRIISGSSSRMWKPVKPTISAPWFILQGPQELAPKGAVHTYKTMRAGADLIYSLTPGMKR